MTRFLTWWLNDSPWGRLLRHHRCSICRLPRPIFLPGDHTDCLAYEIEQQRLVETLRGHRWE